MVSESRYERNSLSENVQFASAYNLITGSLSSGALTDIDDLNDAYMVFAAALVGGSQRIVEVEFTGTHSGHMPFLNVQVQCKTSASTNMILEIKAYNYSTAAYETEGTMFRSGASSTSDTDYWIFSVLNSRNYRDGSGNWKIKITTTRDAGGGDPGAYTVSIDYLHFRTSYYLLDTIHPDANAIADQECRNQTLGIRVWKVNGDDTETEITSSWVATVLGPSSTTSRNNTYTPTATADCVAIVIRVYILSATEIGTCGLMQDGYTPLVFMTEDLNDTLNAAQWTVYYYFVYTGKPFYVTYFYFGGDVYLSRADNFTHAPPAAAGHPYISRVQCVEGMRSWAI